MTKAQSQFLSPSEATHRAMMLSILGKGTFYWGRLEISKTEVPALRWFILFPKAFSTAKGSFPSVEWSKEPAPQTRTASCFRIGGKFAANLRWDTKITWLSWPRLQGLGEKPQGGAEAL